MISKFICVNCSNKDILELKDTLYCKKCKIYIDKLLYNKFKANENRKFQSQKKRKFGH